MAKTTKSINFSERFIKLNTAEDAKTLADKALKQARLSLTIQVNIFKGELLDKEAAVELAKENLENAKVNFGKPITDRVEFKNQLLEHKQALIYAEDELSAITNTIEFLETTLDEYGE